jgi:DNA-directed RNA polymerase alpha subunit
MSSQENNNNVFDIKLSGLDFSIRSLNCFKHEKISNVRELVRYTELDLLCIKDFGQTTLMEVMKVLYSLGLRLGMSDADISYFEWNRVSKGEPPKIKDGYSSLDIKLSDLDFSIRSRNCFKGAELIYVRDVVRYSARELLQIRNFWSKITHRGN